MNVGDVVQLKSGGPLMTVLRIDTQETIVCQFWHPSANKFDSAVFQSAVLKVVERFV